VLRDLPAEQLGATVADFRRFANLYPILPVQYWRADHGFEPARSVVDRARAYVGTPLGRTHVVGLLRARARHAEGPQPDPASLTDAELVDASIGLFASAHDLVVARRHFRDAARTDDQLCSAGDLAPEDHRAFLALTIEALHDLTRSNPSARYVSVFQNWLRPAGASFDHLHKQLVAIDEWGPLMVRVVDLLRGSPDLFNHAVLDVAARERLVIAENDGAVAVAGIGHRYPTIELYATAPAARPWEHEPDVVHAVSDLLHACHAATGPRIPTNEEWHYRPRDADVAMPWRINLKWRVSTLAGFEGGTRINVNTIDPFTLRDTVVTRLADLRADGQVRVARIGDECPHRSGLLPPGG
jgi:galactose-1-phosphate uridylyltransferase